MRKVIRRRKTGENKKTAEQGHPEGTCGLSNFQSYLNVKYPSRQLSVQEKQGSKHSWLLRLHWPLLNAPRSHLFFSHWNSLTIQQHLQEEEPPRGYSFFFLCETIMIVASWDLTYENIACLVLRALLVLIHLIFATNLWGGYIAVTTLLIVAQWGHQPSP